MLSIQILPTISKREHHTAEGYGGMMTAPYTNVICNVLYVSLPSGSFKPCSLLLCLCRTLGCPSLYGTISLTFLARLSESLKISTLKTLNVSIRLRECGKCIQIAFRFL